MTDIPEPNWKKYTLLLNEKLNETDVKILEQASTFKSNEITKKIIEEQWSDTYYGKKSVNQKVWNGEVYRLNSFKHEKGLFELNVAKTFYKDIQGTNATNWIIGDIYGFDYLADGIIVSTLLYDKDGNVILGKRDSGVREEFQKLSIIGGTLDYGVNPFQMIKTEIKEEYGIDEVDIDELFLQSMYYDYKHNPYLVFVTKLNLTFAEINQKFTDNGDYEHSSIAKYTTSQILDFMKKAPERFNKSSMIAFDITLMK